MEIRRHAAVCGTNRATRAFTDLCQRHPLRLACTLVCFILGCERASAAEPSVGTQVTAAASQALPAIERAFISFRIGVPQWMPEGRYRELLALFEKCRDFHDPPRANGELGASAAEPAGPASAARASAACVSSSPRSAMNNR